MAQRQPRLLEPGYLAWLRKQRCACGCGRSAPTDAAHIKSASLKHNKPFSGTMKPDDRWALPLYRGCHMHQHNHGDELAWWRMHGEDPFALAIRYYANYHRENPDANPPYVRKQRSIKERKPRGQRAKIKSRAKPWPHRPFPGKVWHGG